MTTKGPFRQATLFFLVLTMIFSSGCLTASRSFRLGREAMKSGDYERSIRYFQEALEDHPQSTELRTMIFQAKLNMYYVHLQQARAQRAAQDREGALVHYQRALNVFPGNTRLQQEMSAYESQQDETPAQGFVSEIVPPINLNVDKQEKITIRLRNTPITTIFKSVGKSFQVNIIFDKDFRDFSYSFEVENLGFFEIINQLCLLASVQYRVLDASSILVYPNVINKKMEFELRGIKTFFLANTRADEAKKSIMTIFRDQQPLIQEEMNLNALIIRADYNTLLEIERFIHTIDIEKNEVEIDVEILEINRSLINKIGLDFGANVVGLQAGQIDNEGKINQVLNIKDISSTSFFLTIPSSALHLLASSDDNKIIAKPNLRGVEGEEINFMVGDEVPIPETQFGSFAAGGLNTVPTTSYRYKNIGVEIKITPFVHANNEVTLQISLNIQFIASYTGTFPILGKREIQNTIRLKEGETNIIGGLIRDDVRGSISGLPLLSKLPLVGKLFGASENNIRQTDLIFSVTPKIIRQRSESEKNPETIWSSISPLPFMEMGQADSPELRRRISDIVSSSDRSGNFLIISPAVARFPVDSDSHLMVLASSDSELASISISGSISGAEVEIDELRTDFSDTNEASLLKNISGNSFDIGFSFAKPRRFSQTPLFQIKARFPKSGKAVLNLEQITAYSPSQLRIVFRPASSQVEIY